MNNIFRNPVVIKAWKYAYDAHNSINQRRKYTGEPYHVHVYEVARIVSWFTSDPNVVAAAFGHDILEDVKNDKYNALTLFRTVGVDIFNLILQLTNFYTKQNFPGLNREKRKVLEIERLSKISEPAKLIKLADILSNTKSISFYDPDFARIYLKEKLTLLPKLKVKGRGRILYFIVWITLKFNKMILKVR